MKINLDKSNIVILLVSFLLVFLSGFFATVNSSDMVDITLKKALELGYKNNSELKQTQISQEKSELDLKLAKHAVLPKIKLETTYTRMGEAPQAPSTYVFIPTGEQELVEVPGVGEIPLDENILYPTGYEEMSRDNYQTSISINQPVYMGGKVSLGYKQAKKGIEMTDIQAEQKKGEVLNNIIQSYYNMLMAKERVDIEKEALQLVKEHKKIAEASYKAGMVLKNDVLQAEIELSKAENSLNNAYNQLNLAKKSFKNLIGLDNINIGIKEPEIMPGIEFDLNKLYQTAVNEKPELQLLNINKDIIKNNIKLERSNNLPQVMLIGNYTWQGEELNLDEGNGNIIISASMNLFDGGMASVKKEKLQKELENLDETQSSLKDLVKIDIEQQLVKIEEHKNNINVQKLNMKRAEESLNIEQKRFEQGLGKSIDVLQAQISLKQIKMSKMQAEYQYEMTLFNILKKTGRLVDYCEEVINNEK